MEATGIVRRIDELGRIVLPKEMRRTLRIREGDSFEVFVDAGREIILRKYSIIGELGDFVKEYAKALSDSLNQPILICDCDEYVAASGVESDYIGKEISVRMDNIIMDRVPVLNNNANRFSFIDQTVEEVQSYAIMPIIKDGHTIGAVIIFSKNSMLSEIEMKSLEIAVHFLSNQIES